MYWYNKVNFLTVRKKPQTQSGLLSAPCAAGNRMNVLRIGVPLLLSAVLAGCGGGDDAGSTTSPATPQPPSPVGRVLVTDGFRVAKPNTPTRIDLSAFVRGPGATLTELESNKPQACSAAKISGLTAEVTIRDEYLCRYTLTASNGVSSAKGAIHLLASTRAAPELALLSHAMRVGEGETTFNLENLFGADWPSGYELDAASLSVQGGNVQGIAVASGNTIRYTAPATADWDRITFILRSDTRPEENLLGTLFVTVSERVNHPPVIADKKYDFKKHTGTIVQLNSAFTVDLSTLPTSDPIHPDDPEWQFIAHPDGQEWQLIEVASYSASVTPSDPTSVTNKRFNFTAATPGDHIVSYIVGDHQGGYSAGTIRINAMPPESAKDWYDITFDGLTFFAPPLYSEIWSQGMLPGVMWDTGVNGGLGNSIATATGKLAFAYCAAQGFRLANTRELLTLSSKAGLEALRSKYPHQLPYLVTDSNGIDYKAVDLTSGSVTYVPPGKVGYVLCAQHVSEVTLAYIPTIFDPQVPEINTVLSDGRWWNIGTITAPNGVSSISVVNVGNAYVYMEDSVDGSNFRLSSSVCKPRCFLQARGHDTEGIRDTIPSANGIVSVKIMDGADPEKSINTGSIYFYPNAILEFGHVITRNNPNPRYDKVIVPIARRTDGGEVGVEMLLELFEQNFRFDYYFLPRDTPMPSELHFWGILGSYNIDKNDPKCRIVGGHNPFDPAVSDIFGSYGHDAVFKFASAWNGVNEYFDKHPAAYPYKDVMLNMPKVCSFKFSYAEDGISTFYVKPSARQFRLDFFAIIP